MKKIKPNVTLKDIASATGYSVNTVSRALRDKEDISDVTKAKIKAMAHQKGHISNMIASSLRLGYTKTIAVILGDVSNPHFSIMMKEIEEYARGSGYSTFLINTDENDEVEYRAIQSALNKGADGIILCPAQQSKDNVLYLKNTGVPFVLIGRRFESLKTDYVVCNDKLGGYQATKHLIAHGHKDILILNGPTYISSAKERLAGYREALAEGGLPFNERLVCEVNVTAKECAHHLDDLLQSGVHFTGIFAFSDIIAWNAWKHLLHKGLSVPDDYSIIGFDHIQSRLELPFQLATISSYKQRMSISAVDMLLKRIQFEQQEQEYFIDIIDTNLVPGMTVAQI